MNIYRGDIFLTDLNGYIGSEQKGYRPVLIIQNNIGNTYSPTTLVAPITSRRKQLLPTHAMLTAAESGLYEDSIVQCEQLRVIDRSRLKRHIGAVNKKKMEEINKCLRISIGFE